MQTFVMGLKMFLTVLMCVGAGIGLGVARLHWRQKRQDQAHPLHEGQYLTLFST
jgi:hypothetical protein